MSRIGKRETRRILSLGIVARASLECLCGEKVPPEKIRRDSECASVMICECPTCGAKWAAVK